MRRVLSGPLFRLCGEVVHEHADRWERPGLKLEEMQAALEQCTDDTWRLVTWMGFLTIVFGVQIAGLAMSKWGTTQALEAVALIVNVGWIFTVVYWLVKTRNVYFALGLRLSSLVRAKESAEMSSGRGLARYTSGVDHQANNGGEGGGVDDQRC